MRRPSLALLVAVLVGMLGGCDFSPTLDVPLPDFEPALTINGVLAADSTAEVRVTATKDPYLSPYAGPDTAGGVVAYRPSDRFVVPDGAAVELFVDGAPAGALRLEPRLCDSNARFNEPDPTPEARCGAFVSDVVVEPGRTYTVRASAPGFPDAEATVTVPERVGVAVTAGEPTSTPVPGWTRIDRDLTVTFDDPPGVGDRYALMAVSGPFAREYGQVGRCVDEACTETRDTTVTLHYPYFRFGYTTSDPVLLAGARTIPSSGVDFVTFTDDTFDGTARSLKITVRDFVDPDRDPAEDPGLRSVWLVAVDAETFGAYQVAWFGYPAGEDSNPFQEPIDLPSNVEGGYGLLGAVTINEAPVD